MQVLNTNTFTHWGLGLDGARGKIKQNKTMSCKKKQKKNPTHPCSLNFLHTVYVVHNVRTPLFPFQNPKKHSSVSLDTNDVFPYKDTASVVIKFKA